MITEDYVSFEAAKLLKEKGFNEQCYAYYNIFYDNDGKDLKLWRKYPHRAQPNTDYLNVPTLQTAMKWLREEKKLYVNVWADPKDVENNDFRTIFRVHIYDGHSNYGASEFFTYEEACEAGIKYCLENLI